MTLAARALRRPLTTAAATLAFVLLGSVSLDRSSVAPPLGVLLTWTASLAQAQVETTATEAWRSDTAIFATPRAIVVTRDCLVWVADPRSGLYRFGCHGRFLGAAGRVGRGPGEWQRPWLVSRAAADTVALFDPNLQRLTYYTSAGQFVRLRPVAITEQSQGRVMGATAAADGRVLVWTDNYPYGDFRPDEQESYVWGVDPNGVSKDTILHFAGPQSIVNREGRRISRIDAPFRRRPWVLLRSDGLVVGNSGDNSFVLYGLNGVRRTSFAVSLPPALRVTEADRRQYQDSVRASYFEELDRNRYGPELRGQFTEGFDRLMSLVRYPSSWQRYDLAVAADDDTMWLLLPSRGHYQRTWLRVDLTGRVLGRIGVPHRGNVAAAAVAGALLYVVETARGDETASLAAYQWREP